MKKTQVNGFDVGTYSKGKVRSAIYTFQVRGLPWTFLVCRTHRGYALYCRGEWNCCAKADYEAHEDGSVTFQGKATEYRLPKEAMARAL